MDDEDVRRAQDAGRRRGPLRREGEGAPVEPARDRGPAGVEHGVVGVAEPLGDPGHRGQAGVVPAEVDRAVRGLDDEAGHLAVDEAPLVGLAVDGPVHRGHGRDGHLLGDVDRAPRGEAHRPVVEEAGRSGVGQQAGRPQGEGPPRRVQVVDVVGVADEHHVRIRHVGGRDGRAPGPAQPAVVGRVVEGGVADEAETADVDHDGGSSDDEEAFVLARQSGHGDLLRVDASGIWRPSVCRIHPIFCDPPGRAGI